METQMEFKSLTKMRRQRLESGKAEMTENLKLSSRRKELQGKKKIQKYAYGPTDMLSMKLFRCEE